jgi:hypothetical protein
MVLRNVGMLPQHYPASQPGILITIKTSDLIASLSVGRWLVSLLLSYSVTLTSHAEEYDASATICLLRAKYLLCTSSLVTLQITGHHQDIPPPSVIAISVRVICLAVKTVTVTKRLKQNKTVDRIQAW